MDYTQIILSIIGGIVTISTIILPIILNRQGKQNRYAAADEHAEMDRHLDKIDERIDSLQYKVETNTIRMRGIHLLDIIEHAPHKWETIQKMYQEYTNAGGNGMVEKVYNDWFEDYGKFYTVGEIPEKLKTK